MNSSEFICLQLWVGRYFFFHQKVLLHLFSPPPFLHLCLASSSLHEHFRLPLSCSHNRAITTESSLHIQLVANPPPAVSFTRVVHFFLTPIPSGPWFGHFHPQSLPLPPLWIFSLSFLWSLHYWRWRRPLSPTCCLFECLPQMSSQASGLSLPATPCYESSYLILTFTVTECSRDRLGNLLFW